MKRVLLLAVAASFACAKAEEPAVDTTAAAAAPAPAATPIALADVAGRWEGHTTREGSDSVVAHTVLNATADTTGWTMDVVSATDPQTRSTARVRSVTVSGDSLIVETERFRSVVRPGQDVTVRTVYRMENGRLVGTTTATYANGETATLRSESTRK